jgi:butyryl-CoA dehydrogenase
MVLAKLPDAPPGVKGISLFMVPKYYKATSSNGGVKYSFDEENMTRNDIYVGQLQHKMGATAATNAEMVLGDRTEEGALGFLMGNEHEGLKNMFHMMNEARIFVGATACASGIAGYQYSLQYARERKQGRDLKNKDPTSPMIPIIEHADVKRMLLAQKAYAEGSLALCSYGAYLSDIVEHDSKGAFKDSPEGMRCITAMICFDHLNLFF